MQAESGPSMQASQTLMDFVGMMSNSLGMGNYVAPGTFPTSDSADAGAQQNSFHLSSQPDVEPKPGPHSGARARTGCLTCRLRKKRCDEARPSCETCQRLGIDCLGYGKRRPDWLKDEENVKKLREEIREKVLAQRASRPKKRRRSSGGSDESSAEPEETHVTAKRPSVTVTEVPTTHFVDNTWRPPEGFTMRQYQQIPQIPQTLPAQQPIPPAKVEPDASIWDFGSVTGDTAFAAPFLGPNPFETTAITATSTTVAPTAVKAPSPPFNDPELDEMWTSFFNSQTPNNPVTPTPLVVSPNPYPPLPETSNIFNIPIANPEFAYLHHYLNVVMPLQFRTARSSAIGEMVIPLAFQKAEVLTSVSSLAALHLASHKSGVLLARDPLSPSDPVFPANVASDNDALIARAAHRDSVERLRYVRTDRLESEDVIFPALFAVSYFLFMGGTSPQWREVIAICQKCLHAAIMASPDLSGDFSLFKDGSYPKPTPWQRYRPLIEVLITTDIIGALSQNRGTRLLPVYRTILGRINGFAPVDQTISMLDVMGCDNTSLLAIAETTALNEWKDRAEETGTLSQQTLVKRGDAIQKLLSERNWRNSHSNEVTASIETLGSGDSSPPDEWTKTHLMAEVFFAAAKVYIAVVVNGPFPRVPEIAESVRNAMEALRRLGSRYPRPDIFRKLVFPITVTGCHADTEEQKEFFRNCFTRLGPEAAFGNTRSALALMEEVWRKRRERHPSTKVCWRQTMVELGWEAGLLMI